MDSIWNMWGRVRYRTTKMFSGMRDGKVLGQLLQFSDGHHILNITGQLLQRIL